MKKMILIAALTLVLTAAAVPGVAASFAENAGVSVCFIFGDMIEGCLLYTSRHKLHSAMKSRYNPQM